MSEADDGSRPLGKSAVLPAVASARRFGLRGWSQILLCALGGATSVVPVAIIPVSVLMKPLSAAMGWGRGEVSLMLTCLTLSIALAMPAAGFLIDRFGAWKVAAPSIVCFGLGIFVTPMAIEHFGLVGLCVISCINGASGSASSSILYSKLISAWFEHGRGLALGCAMCGIAVGGAVTPVVTAHVVGASGWQAGFEVLAMFPLLIGVPTIFGLRAMASAGPVMPGVKVERSASGRTFSEACRSGTFALLLLASFISALTISSIPIHLAGLISDRGFSPTVGAMAVGGLFLMSVPARIGVGWLLDRMFAPRVNGMCFAGAAIGTALLAFPHGSAALITVSVVLISIGIGAENDFLAYIVARYFGMRAFGQIYGVLFAGFMVGNSIGSVLVGASYDRGHSYLAALIFCAFGQAVSAGALFILPRYPDMSPAGGPAAATPDNAVGTSHDIQFL